MMIILLIILMITVITIKIVDLHAAAGTGIRQKEKRAGTGGSEDLARMATP